MSLDLPRGAGDDEPGEVLADTVGQVEDGYHRVEQRALLEDLISDLRPRDREVLRLRFEHDLTQAQIGDILGISQMQVSRVLRQAIAQLRVVAAGRHVTAESAIDPS
jgi:RNA polymerase sigma-B factor